MLKAFLGYAARQSETRQYRSLRLLLLQKNTREQLSSVPGFLNVCGYSFMVSTALRSMPRPAV